MKRRSILAVLAAALCSLAVPSHSEPPLDADPLLGRLTGNWVLRGKIAGKETTHDVVAEWVLGRQYVRIHEVAREKDGKGSAAYEAIVFVGSGLPSHAYACLWLDSTGGGGLAPQSIGYANRDGDSMPFVFWDDGGGLSFRNTFAYDRGTDSWMWLMDNVDKGKAIPFGRVKLTRR